MIPLILEIENVSTTYTINMNNSTCSTFERLTRVYHEFTFIRSFIIYLIRAKMDYGATVYQLAKSHHKKQ